RRKRAPRSRPRRRWPGPERRGAASTLGRGATGEALGVEQLGAQLHAVVLQLLGEAGPDPGGLEVALEAAVGVDAHAVVEEEDVLQSDHVALHALHLGDVGDASGAVAQSG